MVFARLRRQPDRSLATGAVGQAAARVGRTRVADPERRAGVAAVDSDRGGVVQSPMVFAWLRHRSARRCDARLTAEIEVLSRDVNATRRGRPRAGWGRGRDQ